MNFATAVTAERVQPVAITARERDDLIRSLRRFTRDADVAEDCFQSAFVRLEEYRRTQEVQSDVRFLARAARNIAIDEARKRRVRSDMAPDVRSMIEDTHGTQLPADEVLVVRERLNRAREVLDALPERTRTIFLMHRFTRTKYREIAEQFGVSVSAVEKHIAKAAQALARSVEHENEGTGR
ncbi:RNA polymerase sigma factor [Alteraurantiacibacter buctensis]|uniref:Sigma-70 family RNA polymerase sigma factor n=1 Tax=Alteraurantiacibacter buctensis TaxID=1503981 RepID=A0A844Z2P6_9SPHN|nr:sigma-70 family RNA polymerase sigma factor [Alteraurantiacibacter buctensis]MXO73261.1 sigma-70 family RNA polymerase sigma factor [Alteraurantiacibacter buctensis]